MSQTFVATSGVVPAVGAEGVPSASVRCHRRDGCDVRDDEENDDVAGAQLGTAANTGLVTGGRGVPRGVPKGETTRRGSRPSSVEDALEDAREATGISVTCATGVVQSACGQRAAY